MKLQNIKVGMKLKIVGDKGGCEHNNTKCKDCKWFKKGIIVTDIASGISIYGHSITNERNFCNFCSEDLELIEIDWRKELDT